MTGTKTEKPTPKRLRDLRKKGQVPQSKEGVSAAVMIAFFALLFASLPSVIGRLKATILLPVSFLKGDFLIVVRQLLEAYMNEIQTMVAPFLCVVLIVGVGADLLQNVPGFSPDAVAPSLKRLSPSENIKRIVSLRNIVELGKSIVKVLMLSLVLILVLREDINALVWTSSCGISCLSAVTSNLLFLVATYVGTSYLVVAIADFTFQRWQRAGSANLNRSLSGVSA